MDYKIQLGANLESFVLQMSKLFKNKFNLKKKITLTEFIANYMIK